jgi:hypothetical protein
MMLTDFLLIGTALAILENVSPQLWTVGRATDLSTDGYVVFHSDAVSYHRGVLERLPEGYEFLDYEYTIRGTSLTTWHRDVTSGQSYYGTTHPTYTVIRYEYEGDLLTVIPKSHAAYPFAIDRTQMINGTAGTTILFNADLLHAGAPNKVGGARLARQYKVVHREDRARLAHLEGIHVEKTGEGTQMTTVDWAKRVLSWQWAFLLNLPTVAHLSQERQPTGSVGATLQRIVNQDFFNR